MIRIQWRLRAQARCGAARAHAHARAAPPRAAPQRAARPRRAIARPPPRPAAAPHPAKALVQQQSEFAKRASQIGLSIHKTSVKLQKLAQLAKRSSMFDDPTAEIDELTGIIKHDIQGLNDSIAELQRVSARRAGAAESKQSAEHSHTVVDSLRTRLKDATAEFKEVGRTELSAPPPAKAAVAN